MNMRGVFLHVMADALGSVVVIISAIIIWQTDWEYKYYVDPGKIRERFSSRCTVGSREYNLSQLVYHRDQSIYQILNLNLFIPNSALRWLF